MAVIVVTLRITRTVTETATKKLEDYFAESKNWVIANIEDKLPADATMDNPRYEVSP